jgi:hypothetical protein
MLSTESDSSADTMTATLHNRRLISRLKAFVRVESGRLAAKR